jgi:hypothetical protein
MKILISIVVTIFLSAAGGASARWDGGAMAQAQTRSLPPRSVPSDAEPERRRSEPPQEARQRPEGKLNDEQRRGLHRDLDRANREIYKNQGKR